MTNQVPKFVWIFQLIAAGLFLYFGLFKFTGAETTVFIFDSLGMEPHGRYIIGVLEVLVGFLLLTPQLSGLGSFVGIGVMLGAVLAHATVLGLSVQGDGGELVITLLVVVSSCLVITWFRRREIPFIGSSF